MDNEWYGANVSKEVEEKDLFRRIWSDSTPRGQREQEGLHPQCGTHG